MKRTYGWIRSLPDHRDSILSLSVAYLPPSIDLRPHCPPVYDQQDLGSCTANAIAAAIEFDRMKQNLPDFVPSRLFIYYNERSLEHTTNSDSGASLRDGMKTVAKQGSPPETDWPYVTSKFAIKPSKQAYADALKDLVSAYHAVPQSFIGIKSALVSGLPVVLGISVYESFESNAVAKTGTVRMPGRDESLLGGHAVLCVGYDDSEQRFIVRNSWGASWGMAGYFTIPYTYLTNPNLASDFWVINAIKQ